MKELKFLGDKKRYQQREKKRRKEEAWMRIITNVCEYGGFFRLDS